MADYDLAVIGAGAAGLSVTAVAAQLGLRVALIERGRMGGDCLNYGCVPSKALLAAAHAARAARDARRFGIRSLEPQVDWPALQAHINGVIAAIAPNDSAARFRALGATVIEGEARFTGRTTLTVGDEEIQAHRIVIAAGSEPAIAPVPGLSELSYLTTETLWSPLPRPEHLLILGGGPVGLEIADAYACLGCRVSVVEAEGIAGKEDPELVDGLRRILVGRGVALHEHTKVVAAEPGPILILSGDRRLTGSHLLVATGRRPRLGALNLHSAHVRTTEQGIATDRGLRSISNRRVYAVGDIADPEGVGPRLFTHVGSYHAGVVIRRALFRLPARVDYSALPRVVYTAPELAQVGPTEAEARARGRNVQILRAPVAENDRAQAERSPEGLLKLVVEQGRVVGAGILAPGAGEMITAWGVIVARRVPLSAVAGMVVPYPTLSEVGKRAAQGYYAARFFGPGVKAVVRVLNRLV